MKQPLTYFRIVIKSLLCYGNAFRFPLKSVKEFPPNRFIKFKEPPYMSLSPNHMSQPSLDIKPLWLPLIREELKKNPNPPLPSKFP